MEYLLGYARLMFLVRYLSSHMLIGRPTPLLVESSTPVDVAYRCEGSKGRDQVPRMGL